MEVDVVVVGAGPAGLAASLNLARAQRTVALLDSNRPRHAATLRSHGFLSRDGISPLELRTMGREEVLSYPTVTYERTIVHSISPVDGGFVTVAKRPGTEAQTEVHSPAVLLATGLTEALPLPSMVRTWYGTSLHSCMDCDGYDKRGEPLALIGETDDLAERALVIRRHTDDLVVFTNGVGTITDDDESRLRDLGVVVDRTPIVALEGDREGMREVVLADGRRSQRTGGFVRPVWHASLGFADLLGLERDDEGLVVVDGAQRTSVPGVYAAGDLTPGFRQLAVAAGEGTIASSVINRDLIAVGR
ncbi:NAD(P)/FAD-dependent oxidoreductase [Agrococcus versicolor]|uniref:NAD(P)/FAD-dependent oxidoreductase n=1 Tax=Agrococcus versicolor TaxID=501482 RepID=A0ABN3ALD3_9MICO